MFARIFISALIAIFFGNSFQIKSCLAGDQQADTPSNLKDDASAKQSDKDTPTVSNAGPMVGLPDDWKQNVDVPESGIVPAGKLKLWVDRSWLVARYETRNRGLEWQIVLAQATNPTPPKIEVDQHSEFEIKYGPYFIRNQWIYLSAFRERKTKDSPIWPEITIDEGARFRQGRQYRVDPPLRSCINSFAVGNWEWIGCGLQELEDRTGPSNLAQYHFDVSARLQSEYLPPNTGQLSNPRLAEIVPSNSPYSRFDYAVHDEGDLLVVRRSLVGEEEARTMLANNLKGRAAPELLTKQWFNTPEETSLKKLQGKVVLMYFWSGVDYQPWAASIQKKINGDQLVVIGIHPDKDSEKIEALIAEKRIPIPIAIDTARLETESKYTVRVWPMYFLVDKTGIVRQVYFDHPPPEKDIDDLLK